MRRVAREATLLAAVVVLALIVWFVIADTENRVVEIRLGFSLQVEVRDLGSDLVVASEPLPVTVTVYGREADVEDARPEHFTATVSMRNRSAGQHSLPVRVDTLEGDVRVRAVQPETVVVILQESVEREVPVIVEPSNLPPLGFRVGEPEVMPATATVSGIAAEVEAVESVVARLDLGGAEASLEREVTLEARTASGRSVTQVLVNPRFALVRVPIEQEVFRKTASILPEIIGAPAEGYRVRTVRASPSTIDVLVSVHVLDDEIEVRTEPVDIGGRDVDLVTRATLVFADGAAPAGESDDSVQVVITIEPVYTSVELPITLQPVGVRSGLETAFVSVTTAQVTLRGPVAEISKLEGPLGPLEVNMAPYAVGRHRVDLEWLAPQGIELIDIDPPQIIVSLTPVRQSESDPVDDQAGQDTESAQAEAEIEDE